MQSPRRGALGPRRSAGGLGRRAGGNAVIDHHHRATRQRYTRPITPEPQRPPVQLDALALFHGGEFCGRHRGEADDLVVDDPQLPDDHRDVAQELGAIHSVLRVPRRHPAHRLHGLRQVCVVCCDGLTALPEAIEAVFADAWVQTCVVHLIRNSLKHVSYKDRRKIVQDLRPIYRAATEDEASSAHASVSSAKILIIAFNAVDALRSRLL